MIEKLWLLLPCLSGCLFSDFLAKDDRIACDESSRCPDDYVCNLLLRVCQKGQGLTCARDTECPFGTICLESNCEPGCAEDGDCGLGRACIDGNCSDDPSACNSDALCDFGESCQDGHCRRLPATDYLCHDCHFRWCFGNEDCPDGSSCGNYDEDGLGTCDMCSGGTCSGGVDMSKSCDRDDQCGGDQICYHPACTDSSFCNQESLGSCTDAFAPAGSKPATNYGACSLGWCAQWSCTQTGCSDSDDCPKGYDCFRIIDVRSLPSCTTAADCGVNRECRRVNEQDDTRFCACTSDADCPEGRCTDSGACELRSECQPELGLTCEETRR